jgi:hypothetical protein
MEDLKHLAKPRHQYLHSPTLPWRASCATISRFVSAEQVTCRGGSEVSISQDPTNVSTTGKESSTRVDLEVKVKPEQRRLTLDNELTILEEAEISTGFGQIEALFSRKSRYSST